MAEGEASQFCLIVEVASVDQIDHERGLEQQRCRSLWHRLLDYFPSLRAQVRIVLKIGGQ